MDSAEPLPECNSSSVVHVCAFIVSRCLEQIAHVEHWLSPEEQARAKRFLKVADRRRFVLGRAIVRSICGSYLGIEPVRVRLEQTIAGKPYLSTSSVATNGKRLEFNLAYGGDCVLVAWTEGRAVGIDVEAIERDSSALFNDVSAWAFSRAKRAVLSAVVDPHEVTETFYRIWVRKEAVPKGEGCGLRGSPRSFSVARRRGSGTEWFDEISYAESGRKWRIIELIPTLGHLGALALPPGSAIDHCSPSQIRPWAEAYSLTFACAVKKGAALDWEEDNPPDNCRSSRKQAEP